MSILYLPNKRIRKLVSGGIYEYNIIKSLPKLDFYVNPDEVNMINSKLEMPLIEGITLSEFIDKYKD